MFENSPEEVLNSPFSWTDVDFAEGDIGLDGCEQLIVIIKDIEIPLELVNLKAQQTRLGKIQLHIFISDEFQGKGIATKVYTSFIHQFGGIYSGFGRVMNKPAILSIYSKLDREPDIDVRYIQGYKGEIIGIEATLKERSD